MALFGYTFPTNIGDKADSVYYLNQANPYVQKYETDEIISQELRKKYIQNTQYEHTNTIQKDLNAFTINSIASDLQPQSRMFASQYHNGDKSKEFYYSYADRFIPQSYPAHYINCQRFSPVYLGLHYSN